MQYTCRTCHHPLLSDLASMSVPLRASKLIHFSHPTPHVHVSLQVLQEIAVYKAPSLTHGGLYSLKRDMWKEFDPHFLHYTRPKLSRAWENAMMVGAAVCMEKECAGVLWVWWQFCGCGAVAVYHCMCGFLLCCIPQPRCGLFLLRYAASFWSLRCVIIAASQPKLFVAQCFY